MSGIKGVTLYVGNDSLDFRMIKDAYGAGDGTPDWKPGRYTVVTEGVGSTDGIKSAHRLVYCRCLAAHDPANKVFEGTRMNILYDVSKPSTAPWWRGAYENIAPWALTPQYSQPDPNLPDVKAFDWLIGAKIEVVVATEEFPGKNKETGETETKQRDRIQKSPIKLLEPGQFTLSLLQQAGIDWTTGEVPAAVPNQHHLIANLQAQAYTDFDAKPQVTPAGAPAGNGAGLPAQPAAGLPPQQ
jgi:hypothetical protein